jgi:hypothetical protein
MPADITLASTNKKGAPPVPKTKREGHPSYNPFKSKSKKSKRVILTNKDKKGTPGQSEAKQGKTSIFLSLAVIVVESLDALKQHEVSMTSVNEGSLASPRNTIVQQPHSQEPEDTTTLTATQERILKSDNKYLRGMVGHLNTEINKASWKEDADLKGQTRLVDSLSQKIELLEAMMYRQAKDVAIEQENKRQDIQFLVKELSNLYDLFNHQSLELKSQKSIVENNHISAIKNIHRISETNAEVSMSRSQISQLQTQRARGNEENVALCMRLSELEKVVKVQSNKIQRVKCIAVQ